MGKWEWVVEVLAIPGLQKKETWGTRLYQWNLLS
jgi:hypothetical protein